MKLSRLALRTLTAAVLFSAGFSIVACMGPARFETANLNTSEGIQKNVDTYWKRDGWWGGMKGVKKVAITQFNVEYVTENVNKSGADALSVLGAAEMIGMGRRKRQFAEDFKISFPDKLYSTFVSALQEQGLEVVPVETLTSHASFASLKAAAAGKSQSQGKGGASAKIQTYPIKALPLPDDGFFNLGAADNIRAESKMAGDNGAQGIIRVRIRVALDDEGRAIIGGGSTITTAYEPEKQQWQANQPADWVYKQRGNLIGHGSMRDENPVIDSKEFKAFQGDIYTVNSAKFEGSILKMFPAYAKMAAIKLKS